MDGVKKLRPVFSCGNVPSGRTDALSWTVHAHVVYAAAGIDGIHCGAPGVRASFLFAASDTLLEIRHDGGIRKGEVVDCPGVAIDGDGLVLFVVPKVRQDSGLFVEFASVVMALPYDKVAFKRRRTVGGVWENDVCRNRAGRFLVRRRYFKNAARRTFVRI